MNVTNFCTQLAGLEQSLLKYALFLRLDHDDARDLVQETFLKAIINRDKFVDNGYLKAWTFTIMRNTFINNYRHNILHRTHCERTDELHLINSARLTSSENPDSAYSFKEITQSIDLLKEKFRIPFKMFLSGYKYSEIAVSTKVNVGTVKSRIFLARKVLMNHLN